MKIKEKRISATTGFTLIEILVASIILFSAIATVSTVYSGAFISSEKATQYVKFASVVPSVLANVREEVRAQGKQSESFMEQSGLSWDVEYTWKARLIDKKSAPPKLDVDTGDLFIPPAKYKLWLVELNLVLKTSNQNYQFYELSWDDI